MLDNLERIGRIVAAEGGVEQQAVLQNVVVFSCLDVAGAGGVIGVLVFQCVDDADRSGIAALLVSQDGSGVGEHHVVLGLQALVQAALLALRPGSLDVAVERGRRDLVEREPAGHLGVFVKAEAGIRLKGVDGVAVEEVAIGVDRGGGVEVVQGHVWLDSVGAAAGEKVVVEGDALGVGLTHAAIGKDAAPGDRHADAVHPKALAQLEVAIVTVIEVAGGLG